MIDRVLKKIKQYFSSSTKEKYEYLGVGTQICEPECLHNKEKIWIGDYVYIGGGGTYGGTEDLRLVREQFWVQE